MQSFKSFFCSPPEPISVKNNPKQVNQDILCYLPFTMNWRIPNWSKNGSPILVASLNHWFFTKSPSEKKWSPLTNFCEHPSHSIFYCYLNHSSKFRRNQSKNVSAILATRNCDWCTDRQTNGLTEGSKAYPCNSLVWGCKKRCFFSGFCYTENHLLTVFKIYTDWYLKGRAFSFTVSN